MAKKFNVREKISKEPSVLLDRAVEIHAFNWNSEAESIELTLKVDYFNSIEAAKTLDISEPIKNGRLKPYFVNLKVLNSTLVNPANGNTEADGELKADCTIGEYDFFIAMFQGNIKIFDIIKAAILKADIRKRFDI